MALLTGIAEPEPLADQLRAAGGVVELHAFADHHRFTNADLAHVAARVGPRGMAICTLKDAVKLMKSPALSSFDLDKEDPKTLERYGPTEFGRGALLARKLIETGVR